MKTATFEIPNATQKNSVYHPNKAMVYLGTNNSNKSERLLT